MCDVRRWALLIACFALVLLHSVECLKWRMFPGIYSKECIVEHVTDEQWNLLLDSLDASYRTGHHNGRNLTDREIEMKLKNFNRPMSVDLAFLTDGLHADDSEKPVTFYILDTKGQEIYRKESVSDAQINLTPMGSQGPWTVCFEAEASLGIVEIDLSYFHVNMPHVIGTKFEKSNDLTEEELEALQPKADKEEMEYLAKVEHVQKVLGDMNQLGSSIYHVYYEQHHVKQLLARQYKGVSRISSKTMIWGLIEGLLICLCSVVQVVLVQRLFRNKKSLRTRPAGP